MKENELLMNPWIRDLRLSTYFSETSGGWDGGARIHRTAGPIMSWANISVDSL